MLEKAYITDPLHELLRFARECLDDPFIA